MKAKKEKQILTSFGKDIKKRVIDLDMSLAQLAAEVGTSGRYLNHIMYGRRPNGIHAPKIAARLGLDILKYVE